MSARLDIRDCPSPNHDARPQGGAIDILLLHYTGMETGDAARDRLCDPQAKVSAHYMIDEAGAVLAMVPEDRRAWHAGVASWAGAQDINARSIGIELVNPGHDLGYPDFPDCQMAALEMLAQEILARHPIPARRVLAHSDVAPLRKMDPGEKFDWARLHRAGIGHWVEPVGLLDGPHLKSGDRGPEVAELQFQLADYGYGVEVLGIYDAATEAVVRAFQRHFRPQRVDGVADLSTVATLRLLRDTPSV